MGTEHNNINANDRYKGYTSFHDKASYLFIYLFDFQLRTCKNGTL